MVNAGERPTLGQVVRARREQLGLSVGAAAEKAGLSRGTWVNIESDARKTLPHNYAAVERALNWAPGSIKGFLNGGQPTPIPDQPNLAQLEAAVRAISGNPNRSDPLRRWAASLLDQISQLREAEEAEAARERSA